MEIEGSGRQRMEKSNNRTEQKSFCSVGSKCAQTFNMDLLFFQSLIEGQSFRLHSRLADVKRSANQQTSLTDCIYLLWLFEHLK